MIQCSKCGELLPDSKKFCTKCGSPVSSSVVSQTPEDEKFQITKTMVKGSVGTIAMVMVAIGSVLPWATASAGIFSVSKGGLSGDGWITLGLAVLGIVSFMLGTFQKSKAPFIAGLVVSILVLGIAAYDTVNVARLAADAGEGASASVGVGLIVCLIGGIIGLIASVSGVVDRQSAPLQPGLVTPEESARIREAYKTGGAAAAKAMRAELNAQVETPNWRVRPPTQPSGQDPFFPQPPPQPPPPQPPRRWQ